MSHPHLSRRTAACLATLLGAASATACVDDVEQRSNDAADPITGLDDITREGEASKGDGAIETITPVPSDSGSFRARYVVPTSSELADAAVFAIPRVNWRVEDGVASLQYALPTGLVGGAVFVRLDGALTEGDGVIDLGGDIGKGRCVATATTLICHEEFAEIGDLPLSLEVVRQVAAAEFDGPVAHREAVAQLFGSDPIGFVELDLTESLGPPDDYGEQP